MVGLFHTKNAARFYTLWVILLAWVVVLPNVCDAQNRQTLPPGVTRVTGQKNKPAQPVKSTSTANSNKKTDLPPGVKPLPTASIEGREQKVDMANEAAAAIEKAAEIDRPGVADRESSGGGLGGSYMVRKDARTMTLSVPAPRGLITDRNGKPFAQSKVVWYPALKFGQFEKADKAFIVKWARKRIAQANTLFHINWKISDEDLWQHYRYRRWLALPVTRVVHEAEKKKVEKTLMPGLILHPRYMRYYPWREVAAHIIGYIGISGKLEKGPINYGDPIFEFTEGRSGLEKLFNKVLTGKRGLLRKDYEADGTEVVKKFIRRPKPGGTVVTTLDLDWQVYAQKVLKKHCSRGAFVVIDIQTGEILVMASRPSFDLNDFLPFISTSKYKSLRDDPGTPLFARAFQGGYPPASTFKPVVALSALNERVVTPSTLVYCPAAITIGRHTFKNWTKIPEGDINVKKALARSCNTWFYQVGITLGANRFLNMARRLGYGSKTGLPLIGETPGLIPTNSWMLKHEKRRIMDGDTANLAIGQGVMLASPLQVAQAMAGIARGDSLPQLYLVKQIQDVNGRVLVSHDPKPRNPLYLTPEASATVREGMRDVVNAGYGTGHRGALSYTVLCGKTGTAQWGPKSQNKRLAWFAGFFPYKNPRFAFAALYEGKPNEKLSGGRKAAPMINDFFEHFKKEIKIMIKPPPKAMVVEEDEDTQVSPDVNAAPQAIPVEEDTPGALDPALENSGNVLNSNRARPINSQAPQSISHHLNQPAQGGQGGGYREPQGRRSLEPVRPPQRTNRAIPIDE